MNSRILPNEILEMVFIIMIKHKQYSDLNELKKIPQFSTIIHSLKKYYMLHLYNKMEERAFSTFSEKLTVTKRKRFLSKYTPDNNFESIYDLFEFCKSGSIGTLASSCIFPLSPVPNNSLRYVNEMKYGKLNRFRYLIYRNSDILDNIVIIGKNIKNVCIGLNGYQVFKYYYLNASIIKIRPLKEGIWLALGTNRFGDFYVDVYSEYIDNIYMNGSFIKNRNLLMYSEMEIDCVSTEFDTNYEFYEQRKNYLNYMNQRCYPKFVVLTM